MARSSGFAAAAAPAKNEGHRSARRVVRMSHVNKSNSRSPGARSKRRKMAEPDESKMEQEQELSAGPRAPNTQWETQREGKRFDGDRREVLCDPQHAEHGRAEY